MNSCKKIFSSYSITLFCYIAAVIPLLILGGCTIHVPTIEQASYYYLNPYKNLCNIGRTAIVVLANDSDYPQFSEEITKSLYQSIQKQQLFGMTLVKRTDPSWHRLQLDLDETYNYQQLDDIRQTLKCDAILIGTITEYQPYPHLMLGLRLKLIDLKDGQLIWGLEQIWDSADKSIEQKIKKYFRRQKNSGFEPLRDKLVTFSHLEFIKFVSYEVSNTMIP